MGAESEMVVGGGGKRRAGSRRWGEGVAHGAERCNAAREERERPEIRDPNSDDSGRTVGRSPSGPSRTEVSRSRSANRHAACRPVFDRFLFSRPLAPHRLHVFVSSLPIFLTLLYNLIQKFYLMFCSPPKITLVQ